MRTCANCDPGPYGSRSEITLSVFVPFVVLYMHQPVKLDYLWAALCLCGAVYFVFRT